MTDELLPPDPSKDGWYWVDVFGVQVAAVWVPSTQWWMQLRDGEHMTAGTAWRAGYRLASPHPIPTPEQLDALWCVMKWLGQPAFCPSAAERYRQAGREHVHEMLRAALGAKP